VNSPYTAHPADAFAIAQTATAVALTATFPDSVAFATGLGAIFGGHFFVVGGLRFAAFVVTVALVVARPHWVGAIALAGEIFLYGLSGYLVDSDQELMATISPCSGRSSASTSSSSRSSGTGKARERPRPFIRTAS
jgi:hypothetical protein